MRSIAPGQRVALPLGMDSARAIGARIAARTEP
jgi:hypothetical protein